MIKQLSFNILLLLVLFVCLTCSQPSLGQDDFLKRQLKLFGQDKSKQSIQECTARIAANEKDALAYAVRALAYSYEFQPRDAAKDLKKSEELAPKHFHAACCRAAVLASFGKVQDAYKAMKPFEKQIPTDPFALTVKANILLAEDNYWECERVTEAALKIDPSNVDAMVVKSYCLSKMQRFEESKKLLTKILEFEPERTMAVLELAAFKAVDEKSWREGLKELNQIASGPQAPRNVYGTRAYVYMDLAMRKEANLEFEGRKISQEEAWELALKDARVAAALHPNDPSFLSPLYQYYMSRNEPRKALEVAVKATKIWRFDSSYWVDCADANLAMSKFQEEKLNLEKAEECNPNSTYVLHALEACCMGLEQWADAEKYGDRVIDIAGNGIPDAFYGRATSRYHQSKWKEAEQDLTKYMELVGVDAGILENRAECRKYQSKWKEAAEDYATAIKLEPENASIYASRGDLWFSQEKWELAEKDLTKAIELNPKDSENYRARSNIRYRKRDLANAVKDCERAIELDPKNDSAYFVRGCVRYLLNQREEAAKDFAKANELGIDVIPSLLGWTENWMKKEKWAAAESELNMIIFLEPKNHLAFKERAFARGRQKKFKEAEEDLKRLIILRPNDSASHHRLGSFLVVHKRHEEALPYLSRAIELNPKDVHAFYWRACILSNQNKWEEALPDFAKTLELNPNSEKYQKSHANAVKKVAERKAKADGKPAPMPMAPEKSVTKKMDTKKAEPKKPDPPLAKKAGPTRVFIFAGQSNMVGADARDNEIDKYPSFKGAGKPQSDVLYVYKMGRNNEASEKWGPLKPVGSFGPELTFARVVKTKVDFPIAIIKSAVGGTTLAKDWNPSAPDDGLKLYPRTLKLIRDSLKQFDEQGIEYQLEAVCWHQGENDMLNAKFNPSYGARLKAFIPRLRKDLNAPDLLFLLGEASEKGIWGMDHREQLYSVTSQQRSTLRKTDRAEFVPTSHLAFEVMKKGQPHYHFGTQGQLQLGEAFAEAYLNHRKGAKVKTVSRPKARLRAPKNKPVHLFVFAGQRNMEGEDAYVSEISKFKEFESAAKNDQSIPFSYSIGGGVRTSSGWEAIGPIGFLDNFGPELSFAKVMKEKLKGRLAILKFTDSGAQIPDWRPGRSSEPARSLYKRFGQAIVSAKRELEKAGYEVKVSVFWHPGENDTYYHYHKAYGDKLLEVISTLRKDTRIPDMHWYVSEQHPSSIWKNVRIMNGEIQYLTDTDKNCTFVNTASLPHGRLHFGTEGTLKLGVQYAEFWLKNNQDAIK